MLIDNLMYNEGPNIYYDSTFRNTLEDHLTFLKTHPRTTSIPIDALKAYKYEFDLFGLLMYYGVSPHLHWIIMRMNKMIVPTDADATIEELLIPDATTLDRIRQSFMSTRRIT